MVMCMCFDPFVTVACQFQALPSLFHWYPLVCAFTFVLHQVAIENVFLRG